MSFFKDLPSPSSFFSAYASMAGYLMLIRSMVHDMIPLPVQDFIFSSLRSLFGSHSSTLTLTIDCDVMGMSNEIYDAAQTYLSTKISPEAATLRITKGPKDKHVNVYLSNGEIITDLYQGIELKWRFLCNGGDKKSDSEDIREYFELSFDKKHRDLVLNSYIQHVLSKANEIEDGRRILKMYTLNCLRWECVNLEHPSTFDTMAMDEELKRSVIDDLDRFIKRRDFYKRVGKAWKRGYLLYGPPGTGKSSLVAAMANYLKFDVYDLQLAGVMRDSDLRRLLLGTHNRSILVVEDIDCAVDLPNRLQAKEGDHGRVDLQGQLTLSGLLNFIDGLWSSCGDERIIIFTTNHKEKLDPALLRPGRMDMHIYMGHCTFQGFKTLASNYLGLPYADDSHHLYDEIKHTIQEAKVTPAQIAEELMKSEEIDVALEGLIKLLEKKGSRGEEESKKAETEEKSNSQEKTKSKSDDTTTPRKSKGRSMKKLVLFWSFVC